jgi:hypothetical protein
VYDANIACCVPDRSVAPSSEPTGAPSSNGTFAPVEIIDPKACLCNEDDKKYTFEAKGNPPGGTYAWTITAPQEQAVISGASNSAQVVVDPVKISTAADDVTLKVTYTPPGLDPCDKEVKFTVVKATLAFKSAGAWTRDDKKNRENDIKPLAIYGHPSLGPQTPGDQITGWYKNIEIEATIQPCVDPLPRCKFNWQSEKLGYSGIISPPPASKFTDRLSAPPDPNAANGGWKPDHPNDSVSTDEKLESAELCKLYMIDSPGWPVGQNCQKEGVNFVLFNHKNYRSWLEIDGMQCTDKLVWRASTRIICKETAPNVYQWSLDDPLPTSNEVGSGGFDPLFVPPGARRALEELNMEEPDIPNASWLSAVVDFHDKV